MRADDARGAISGTTSICMCFMAIRDFCYRGEKQRKASSRHKSRDHSALMCVGPLRSGLFAVFHISLVAALTLLPVELHCPIHLCDLGLDAFQSVPENTYREHVTTVILSASCSPMAHLYAVTYVIVGGKARCTHPGPGGFFDGEKATKRA